MRELVAYRCAAWETPFWADPNPVEGRFNRAGEAPTTYLGLHPLTAWAELLRALGIRDRDEAAQVRPPLWAARVVLDEDEVLDLTFGNAPDFGLTAEDLVADDRRPCQQLASRLRAGVAAPKAIVAPSAALPGTRNLVLLGERVISPLLFEPVNVNVNTPASVAAVRGRVPLGLVELVHYRDSGTRHASLEAWEIGEDHGFEEPELPAEEIALA